MVDETAIRTYEAAYDIQLPADYVEFLLLSNGATCRQDRAILLSNGVEVLCDCLFGLGRRAPLCINFWQEELSGELPKRCVVIGSSPGGGLFLLLELEMCWQIWYYDHSYAFASTSDSENTYACNIELKELLALAVEQFDA